MLDTHMHTTSKYAHARVYHLASIVTSLTEPITCIASSYTATLCKWISNHRLDVCGWQAQLIQLTCHNDPACLHTSDKPFFVAVSGKCSSQRSRLSRKRGRCVMLFPGSQDVSS